MRRTRGFTAVEMLGVLALAALMAGMTTLSLSSLTGSSKMDDVLDRLSYCDTLARQIASRNRAPVRLILEPQAGAVGEKAIRNSDDDSQTPHTMYRLPDGWRIDRMIRAPGGEKFGTLDIGISAAGRSSSYAIRLTGPHTSRWLVVFGLTGQVKQANDEQQVSDMLGPSGSEGNDAG